MECHEMPGIVWTVKAGQRLRCALAAQLRYDRALDPATGSLRMGGTIVDAEMERIGRLLSGAFPDADSVVIQERFQGFRPRPGEHIFLVEVSGGLHSGPCVVKIGPCQKLSSELRAWEICRPLGLHHDLVFLPLREGACEDEDPQHPGGELRCLIYGDAQQLIGINNVTSLEDAVLGCVRFGVPRVDSIHSVLEELFVRIGHLFYTQSFVSDPSEPDYALRVRGLEKGLALWRERPDLVSIRTDCDAAIRQGIGSYLDPVDYVGYVLEHIDPTQPGGAPASLGSQTSAAGPAPLASVVPRLLRGCAHGDLHGRNILVGIVRERAMWPAVFDYEDMGPDNLIGWDFVKLETELKIRAYPAIFAGGESSFISAVSTFEKELNAMTEQAQLDDAWPSAPDATDGRSRLRSILLLLRQMASYELGSNRGRFQDWLEEYRFLLACYAVYIARFENLHRRELIGGYISAGCAVAQMRWPLRRFAEERRAQATDIGPRISYLSLLEMARDWTRSGDRQMAVESISLLTRLRAEYPYSLLPGQELVLAHMESGQEAEAEQVLGDLEHLAREPSEEVLCRWGRLYKENGDRYVRLPGSAASVPEESPEIASRYYRRALGKYQEAYQIRRGPYPGINVSALNLTLAALADADDDLRARLRRASQEIAAELLDGRANWPAETPENDIWNLATEAEANLLVENWSAAADLYRLALMERSCRHFHVLSMQRQAERILYFYRALGVTEIGPMIAPEVVFAFRGDRQLY